MPLDQFIETLSALEGDADEILVEGTNAFRNNAGPNEHTLIDTFNTQAMTRLGRCIAHCSPAE
jgi:uncharacterized oxidoreductase